MKKYEAPIAELDLFVVENVMDGYTEEDPLPEVSEDDTPWG